MASAVDRKRPPTVWLTQSIIVIFVLLFLFILLLNFVSLLRHPDNDLPVVRLIAGYSVIVAFIILLVVAFYGLVKRATYGRWLGVLSLVLILILLIVVQVSQPTGPYQYYEYDNTSQLAGAICGRGLQYGLILTLILRLSFSKKVAEFFSAHVEERHTIE
jgi:hypothetical protein